MAAGLTEGRVLLVRGEPVNQIALRDHVLVLQRQGAELSEADPLADCMAVIAGEIHNGGHVDHVQVSGELTFVVAPRLLWIVGKGRLNADLVGLHVLVSVFVPVLLALCTVPGLISRSFIKSMTSRLLDSVAAGFLAGAGVRNQVELEKIERRLLADVAGDPHLLLVHNLRIFFEFLGVVFHNEDSFLCFGPKGCFV